MSEDGWDDWGNENIESTPAANNNNRQNDNRHTDSRRINRDNRHDDESWNERRGPGRNRDNDRGGENSESLKVTYEYQYDDNLNYDQRVNQGIDFEKYDEIPVKCTVPDSVKEELGEIEPIAQFSEILDLNHTILENIKKCKWIKPTPIPKFFKKLNGIENLTVLTQCLFASL